MKKYYLLLAAGALSGTLIRTPVQASDAPADEGNYIWQDENGNFWWRNGSEDEYIGDGNYAPDPDSGELMEANDAGWTDQDGYFEPHYYYENGSVWWENGDEQTYIGSRDQYYIDDYGNLQELPSSASDNNDSNWNFSDADSNDSSDDTRQRTGELHLMIDFQSTDQILESMPDGACGYSELRRINDGKSMALALKVANTEAHTTGTTQDFVSEYYAIHGAIDSEESIMIASYPATRFHYQTALNEDTRDVNALVCQTDDYTFGLLILTPPDDYDDASKAVADQLISSADLIYAERLDLAQTDYFQVLTPERWKYLCHYETTLTEHGGYTLTYYNEDVPVLTLEARYYDGTDQPLDSVWQGYLGRIETWDGSSYDLLATISQYSEDATDAWKEMYNSYEDVLNGIRIMDGCSLTEGSHA